MKLIESKSNPIIKKALATIQGKTDLVMIEGYKLLQEALKSESKIDFILTSDDSFINKLNINDLKQTYKVPQKILNSISNLQTPPSIISFINFPNTPSLETTVSKEGIHVILDRLQDPGNAGTIIRTAEAMGASSVIFLKGSCSKNNYKLIRAAMGSAFRLPLYDNIEAKDLFNLLKQNKIQTICADMQGTKTSCFKFLQKCAIFFGQEGRGISDYVYENCNDKIAIPMHGKVESLNVAISAAICLYEWASSKQQK